MFTKNPAGIRVYSRIGGHCRNKEGFQGRGWTEKPGKVTSAKMRREVVYHNSSKKKVRLSEKCPTGC